MTDLNVQLIESIWSSGCVLPRGGEVTTLRKCFQRTTPFGLLSTGRTLKQIYSSTLNIQAECSSTSAISPLFENLAGKTWRWHSKWSLMNSQANINTPAYLLKTQFEWILWEHRGLECYSACGGCEANWTRWCLDISAVTYSVCSVTVKIPHSILPTCGHAAEEAECGESGAF